jgi:hypothetical protein
VDIDLADLLVVETVELVVGRRSVDLAGRTGDEPVE